jgi:membrane-bound ClpP family serine protease
MSDASAPPTGRKAAGAFDVRNVIAGLIGLYGVVLVIVGLVGHTDEALEKTGGVNANLWAGIAMIVVAAGFALWSRLRSIVVEVPKETGRDRHGH